MDEFRFNHDYYDLSELEMNKSNIDFNLAINPYGNGCWEPFNPILPKGQNVFVAKLKNAHRYSLEIALLLLHLQDFIEDIEDNSRCLTYLDNRPIDLTCFPTSIRPLWVLIINNVSFDDILKAICKEIGTSNSDIILLYQEEDKVVLDWCDCQNWKYIYFEKITGIEAQTVILFDIKGEHDQNFVFSNANNSAFEFKTPFERAFHYPRSNFPISKYFLSNSRKFDLGRPADLWNVYEPEIK